MTDDGINVVLTATALGLGDLVEDANSLGNETQAVSAELDEAQQRIDRLTSRLGIAATADPEVAASPGRLPAPVSDRSWEDTVRRARIVLVDRTIDPDTVALDDLLDPVEVARIERRHQAGFSVEARLDRYDVAAAVAAGLVASIVDAVMVSIPKTMRWNDTTQRGSVLTKALRDNAVDSDNWLARLAKVPYDQITGTGIEGIGPATHRIHTFGHDPLLGPIMGTLDILRGTMTGVSKKGVASVIDANMPGVANPFAAFAIQMMHLLSDLPTRMGLPLPGWTALVTINAGSLGVKGQTVGEVARQMYLRGYDSWHFLSMSTVPATVELIARSYWGLRSHLDDDFNERTGARDDGRVSTSDRFESVMLLAHGVATAGNIAKISAFGGNPLALNYSQWLRFSQQFLRWANGRLISPTEVVLAYAATNQIAIEEGWAGLDAGDPEFPTLELAPTDPSGGSVVAPGPTT